MHLAADLDGGIMWASEAFCEWSGWTLNELQNLGWVKISVDDENLAADRQACEEMKAGSRTTYQIEKQYYKKDGTRNWGLLHVRAVSKSDGRFDFAWCSWTPLKNGNATAFAKAMDNSRALEKRLEEMIAEVRSVTQRSDEENWALSTIRMAMRHPRWAIAVLVVLASLLGLDSVLSILRGIGFLPTPIHVEKVQYDSLPPGNYIASQGIWYDRKEDNEGHASEVQDSDTRSNITFVTAGGNTITTADRSVLRTGERTGLDVVPDRRVDRTSGNETGGFGSLPSGESLRVF